MTKYYWIGGSGTWIFGDATHWSLSSGGPAQPNSPMWTDDVVFDVNSSASAYTVTISSNAPCTNITIGNPLSGSVTIKNGSFIYGNLTIAAGAIVTSFLPLMKGVGGIQNVQSNGCAIGNLGIYSTSTVMLLDDLLVPTGNFELTNGNFDANGHNMTVSGFATDGVCTNSHIYLRSGIITVAATLQIYDPTSTLTLVCGTSTIRLTGVYNSCFYTIGGLTFYNIWVNYNAANPNTYMAGSFTCNNLKLDPGVEVDFSDGDTFTLGSFTAIGTLGHYIKLSWYSGTSSFKLVSSGSIMSCDYLNVGHSNASPALKWYTGVHNINSGSNTGWVFGAAPNAPVASSLALALGLGI
jgi:hypothetical protein